MAWRSRFSAISTIGEKSIRTILVWIVGHVLAHFTFYTRRWTPSSTVPEYRPFLLRSRILANRGVCNTPPCPKEERVRTLFIVKAPPFGRGRRRDGHLTGCNRNCIPTKRAATAVVPETNARRVSPNCKHAARGCTPSVRFRRGGCSPASAAHSVALRNHQLRGAGRGAKLCYVI